MSLSLIEYSSFDGDVIIPGEKDKKKGIFTGNTGDDKVRPLLKYTIIIVNIVNVKLELFISSIKLDCNQDCRITLTINVI